MRFDFFEFPQCGKPNATNIHKPTILGGLNSKPEELAVGGWFMALGVPVYHITSKKDVENYRLS